MQELPAYNAGGRKDCSYDNVGISRILLFETQLQLRGDFLLKSDDAHTLCGQMKLREISM